MTLKQEITDRINSKMDQLQIMMESNHHLSERDVVLEHIHDLLKYWSRLDEGDREYIEFCQYAIENNSSWTD